MKIQDIYNGVSDYMKALRYGDPVRVYPVLKMVSTDPITSDQKAYWDECFKWLDKYIRLYNAYISDVFYDMNSIRYLNSDSIKYYMTKHGNADFISEVTTTDLFLPSCRWGYMILDYEGSDRIYDIAKRENVKDCKYMIVGIVIGGRPPSGLGGLMTHGRSIVVWKEQIGPELSKPENCGKLLAHEMMHVFGANHDLGSNNIESNTVLGNIYIDPYRITSINKEEVESFGLKVTKEVTVTFKPNK